jgi:hypothetical protein
MGFRRAFGSSRWFPAPSSVPNCVAHSKAWANLACFWRAQELLEVAILGKHIPQRLVDHFISRNAEESGVLVELQSGICIEPDGGANPTNLVDLKQRHCECPFDDELTIF